MKVITLLVAILLAGVVWKLTSSPALSPDTSSVTPVVLTTPWPLQGSSSNLQPAFNPQQ